LRNDFDNATFAKLVHKSAGLFKWADIACRFLNESRKRPARRLDILLQNGEPCAGPGAALDEIYESGLTQSLLPSILEEEEEELVLLNYIVGSLAVLQAPLSIPSLSLLLGTSKREVDQTLEDLHSIIDVPVASTFPLRLHHSLRDFLFDKRRCGGKKFWIDEQEAHRTIFVRCMEILISLHPDICNMNDLDINTEEVAPERVERYLTPERQYACLYWAQHLSKARLDD
jgi:hypothetical protein